jgi:UDP-N-acetylglucosamine 2-epimerase (non-hydrolysing)
MSTHPRTRRRIAAEAPAGIPGVELLPPFGFFDWVRLESAAWCVLSDSGSLSEEAAALGFPAVMLREANERPEGMDAGVAVMAGIDRDRVLEAVRLVTAQGPPVGPAVGREAIPAVSRQVVRVVMSYVDYVRRTVWYRTEA